MAYTNKTKYNQLNHTRHVIIVAFCGILNINLFSTKSRRSVLFCKIYIVVAYTNKTKSNQLNHTRHNIIVPFCGILNIYLFSTKSHRSVVF